jgi:hypothetical protein
MVNQQYMRSHYNACVQEIAHLDRAISRLQLRMRQGSAYWRTDQEQLAGQVERRHALAAQRQALFALLTPEGDEVTVATPRD